MSAMFLQFKGRFIRVATVFAFFLMFFSCSDAVRDDFPRRSFVGYFDLSYAEYSQSVFTARRDMMNDLVGVNGIVVYNSGGTYYAFDLMCPHEKSTGCNLTVDLEEDPSIAVCSCCGSKYLLASPYGEVIEGPASRNLHVYETGVSANNILVVSSGY